MALALTPSQPMLLATACLSPRTAPRACASRLARPRASRVRRRTALALDAPHRPRAASPPTPQSHDARQEGRRQGRRWRDGPPLPLREGASRAERAWVAGGRAAGGGRRRAPLNKLRAPCSAPHPLTTSAPLPPPLLVQEVAPQKEGKWYPADDIKKPVPRNFKPTAAKLRKSITPGTIVILLAGRFKGRRAVFLKQLPSGLLLVTGAWGMGRRGGVGCAARARDRRREARRARRICPHYCTATTHLSPLPPRRPLCHQRRAAAASQPGVRDCDGHQGERGGRHGARGGQ